MAQSRLISIAALILAAALLCPAQDKSARSVTIVFRDGHQKVVMMANGSRIDFQSGKLVLNRGKNAETIPISDVARIDFGVDTAAQLGRNHFVGKWEVGTAPGMGTFIITLDRNGEAHKSLGAGHGTWVVVGNEARITWDDGWQDAIRKVGDKHEKVAHAPGTSFDDTPSNVTEAKSLNAEPI